MLCFIYLCCCLVLLFQPTVVARRTSDLSDTGIQEARKLVWGVGLLGKLDYSSLGSLVFRTDVLVAFGLMTYPYPIGRIQTQTIQTQAT